MKPAPATPLLRIRNLSVLVLLVLLVAGCDGSRGRRGKPGPPGDGSGATPTDDTLQPTDDSPGLVVEILGVTGGSGAGGAFLPGDTLSLTFRLDQGDGSPWLLSDLDRLRALVSGPTFNYQRVIAEQTDLLTATVDNGDGTLTYTFPVPLPDSYLPPLNDSDAFGADDGELQGTPLLSGTYTVGLYGFWDYTVDGDGFRDVGDATFDFLLGDAATLNPRAVSALQNCNTCHEALQAHGGARRNFTICVMCHTSGAEDRIAEVAGGTPGTSIDFRIMIHRIHNGAHLPSVLGVGVDDDGEPLYGLPGEPYQVIGFGDSVHDYSEVEFPVWPSLAHPMPRDAGYTALSTDDRATDDAIRRGVVACHKCHGDPDGDGPLAAPAGGQIALQQPTRNACGSCHDDIDWEKPYVVNEQTMPPQLNDSSCIVCHPVSGTPLAVEDAHRHPLHDPDVNTPVVFGVTSVAEDGAHDGDGTLDAGEKVAVTFTLQDALGNDVLPTALGSLSAAFSGPTWNMQLLLSTSVPPAAVQPAPAEGAAASWVVNLPETRPYEYVGDSDGGGLDAFATTGAPHWHGLGADTTVRRVAGTGDGASTLALSGSAPQNFVDLVDSNGFLRNDALVIEPGTPREEYLVVQFVDGDRLWFSSPATAPTTYAFGLRFDHPAGSTVEEVLLESVPPSSYALDVEAGTLDETVEFGPGAVLVSYTTDFVLPEAHGVPLNGSPEVDETWGDWEGKALVDGTYRVLLWGYRDTSVVLHGESTSYRFVSMDDATDVLVGSATELEPYALISGAENCYACHDELRFHGGGRAGYDTCLMCHGASGGEDRPQYVAANAPATSLASIEFRQMIHSIHRGADLANASAYTLVGFGSGYPNNFSAHTYEHVHFPAMPDGTKSCGACHGEDNEAWLEPADREHPTEQGLPVRDWRSVCSSCHDGDDALAHIEVQTSAGGLESCGVCHGPGKPQDVELMHKVR